MKGIDDKAFRKWRGETLPKYNSKQFKFFILLTFIIAVAGVCGVLVR